MSNKPDSHSYLEAYSDDRQRECDSPSQILKVLALTSYYKINQRNEESAAGEILLTSYLNLTHQS